MLVICQETPIYLSPVSEVAETPCGKTWQSALVTVFEAVASKLPIHTVHL